jgi:hypothetical protein
MTRRASALLPFAPLPHLRRPVALARRLAGPALLVLALLWAQLLGLAHGVRHAGWANAGAATVAATAAQDVWTHLAAAASDSPDCRLYDQIGQGGPAPLPLQAPVDAPPPVWAGAPAQGLPAAVCAAYAARAPPAAR